MRVSVDSDDPGYTTNIEDIRVFLDGVEQRYCRTADDVRGEALITKIDVDGNFVIENDMVARQWKAGEVQIILPEGWVRHGTYERG